MAPIDPDQFVAAVQPLLERRDVSGLTSLLKGRWTSAQITSLLSCKHNDARNVAALALSLVGCKRCIKDLAERLKDPDPVANQMAEHALWSVWFRSGTPQANRELRAGTQALNDRDFEAAAAHFTRATELDPDFAEAYNQRAIAAYLQERYDDSTADCLRTVERMPCHFGAWAGLGHCHAHEGRLREAVACYERALEINPHLDCVRQGVQSLREQLARDEPGAE